MKNSRLHFFNVDNFKAIRDSGALELGWLTVFVGNNGSGKSSLVEALETFRDVVIDGVDAAFRRWRGFEHVWNKAPNRNIVVKKGRRPALNNPMRFGFDLQTSNGRLSGDQGITQGPGGNSLFIQTETLRLGGKALGVSWVRDDAGKVESIGERSGSAGQFHGRRSDLSDGQSMIGEVARKAFEHWQFLMLDPERMGQPVPQQRTAKNIRLAKDGSNVAEYLNEIRELNRVAFDGILEAVQYVLPYAADLQPTLTSELERSFYLNLKEESFEVPGWLLSSGTLRIVALLAVLRHPMPPPLLVIEEIENGLDPRTLQMVVNEIRAATESKRTQVILTTHSPALLDLLPLSSIVMTQRTEKGVTFTRPAESKDVQRWAEDFSPGQLYLMNRLDAKE
ncbi:MAG TPA: AAA family ATPase [Gemmataceae bacterium]|jgi:predicted ATPase|nr:AAA family ATPase [Gemmataceae bacterium]